MAHTNDREDRREEERERRTPSEAGAGEDFEVREYRDAEGNVHRHTKKYLEDHAENE